MKHSAIKNQSELVDTRHLLLYYTVCRGEWCMQIPCVHTSTQHQVDRCLHLKNISSNLKQQVFSHFRPMIFLLIFHDSLIHLH